MLKQWRPAICTATATESHCLRSFSPSRSRRYRRDFELNGLETPLEVVERFSPFPRVCKPPKILTGRKETLEAEVFSLVELSFTTLTATLLSFDISRPDHVAPFWPVVSVSRACFDLQVSSAARTFGKCFMRRAAQPIRDHSTMEARNKGFRDKAFWLRSKVMVCIGSFRCCVAASLSCAFWLATELA